MRWTWADSIATEAAQKVAQLKTAKQNRIEDLKRAIKSVHDYVKKLIKILEKKITKPTTVKEAKWLDNKLMGLKQKLLRAERNQQKLKKLESDKQLKIVFGSKKLFNAQHYLEENGYISHDEWYRDWMDN